MVMGESRTILTEHVPDGEYSPLRGGNYYVIACRLVAQGGFESDNISARVVDNHFLIINKIKWNDSGLEEILGIVDINKPEEAEERMYLEAKKIAERRAKCDENTIIDITSKAETLPEEAKYYTLDNWGASHNYATRKKQLALRLLNNQ